MVEAVVNALSSLSVSTHAEAKDKILVIQETFNASLNGAQLDYLFSTLFAERNGIIGYIREKFRRRDFGSSIVDAFKLLAYLILQNFKKWLESYVVDIKNVCLYCIVLDQSSADQKEKAFDVLLAVFENGSWQRDLEVSEVINKLLCQITRKKLTPKVLAKEYHVLGIIARKHPDHMLERSNEVLRYFFDALDRQTSGAPNVSFPLIEGCMNGLTEFLYSFTQSPDDSPENCKKIYCYLMKLSSAQLEMMTKRTALRAALNLLAKHGSQFSTHLYKDYKHWHEYLNKWLSLGREDIKVVMSALTTFYEQVMSNLQNSQIHDRPSVLQYFMKFFKNKLLRPGIMKQEQHIVINAFGMFAGPCRALISQDDVSFMFLLTVQKAKEIYEQKGKGRISELKYMADYVASLSRIIVEVEVVSADQLTSFQRVIVMLIEVFPELPAPFKPSAVRSVAGAFYSVVSVGSSALDGVFTTVVYQGVIRTCSHPVALDVELQKDQLSNRNNDQVSYKDYVLLWTGVMQLKQYRTDVPLASRHIVINKIYDEFVSTVMSLSAKLNLETKRRTRNFNKEEDVPVLDPEAGLEAVVPQDFQVFINLCDLCRDVLTTTDVKLFRPWVHPFCLSVVRHIHHKPLVSGFYKLLTVALQLCSKLEFFKDYASASEDSRKPCYLLLTKFLSEVTSRCQQYKGDLQISCTQTVLAAPVELVAKFVHQTQSAFQVFFHLGHSNVALAHLALSTLERWYSLLPASDTKPLLKAVLPDLDAYLRSLGIEDQTDADNIVKTKCTTSRSSLKSFARRKNLLERPETDLLKLQRRIFMFLGQLDAEASSALINGQETECVSWDTNHHLEYAVMFADIKVPVHLDEFLPRVVDLALSCSNRQIRVSACEFLHAVVMYMLGRNKIIEPSKPGHLHKLFEKLMMPLLQLGCDSDQVVYQLFNPLMLQLTRWYTSRIQIHSKHTQVLLLSLMDGITHPTDTAVQDLSAKCLHEFVMWAIKHSALTEQSNVNVKAILKMMCSFCIHPSSVKRLGGALVFNSTYMVLREEETIVDQHWLDLLYHLVCNLALADPSGTDGTDTAQQVALALDRIARVLTERVQLFRKPSKNRRVPPEFKRGSLEDAIEWLLQKCGSLQPDCQRKCMELVCHLAPLLPEYGSAANFLQHHDISELHVICNGSKLSSTLPIGASPSQIISWLDELLASLKYYLWLIGERLLSPEQLFGAEIPIRFFNIAEYFVGHVFSKTIGNMVLFLNGDADLISILEEEHFDQKKCSIIVNLLNLAATILRCAGNMPDVPLRFLSSSAFCHLVASCTFHPLELGFDVRNLQLLEALPESLKDLLKASCRVENVYKSVLAAQRDMFSAIQETILVDVEASMKTGTVTEVQKQLIDGITTLQTCGMLSLIGCKLVGEEILNVVLSALVKMTDGVSYLVKLEPTIQMYGESVLKLSFSLGDQVDVLVHCVLNESWLCTEVSQKRTYLGDHFLSTFSSAVLDQLLCHVETSVGQLLDGPVNDRSLNVVTQLLHHLLLTKHDHRFKCSAIIKEEIVCRWDAMKQWANTSSDNTVQLLGLLCDLTANLEVAVGSLKGHMAIAEWVASQITSRLLQLLQKDRALDLLPCLTGPDEETNLLVTTTLKGFKDQHIPHQSAELPSASLEYSGFISAFNKILTALEVSGSRILLFSVISMAAGDRNHICEENIQTSLHYFISRLQLENQVRSLEVPYMVYSSRDYDPTIRLSAALRFCRTMLQASCSESLRRFMVVHVQQLLQYISQTWLAGNKQEADHQLVERIGAWAVFELLFCQLEQSELEAPECPITQAAFPGGVKTGKELLVELTKRALNVRKENIPALLSGSTDLTELFRKYQCAAYNAVISIISNSKRAAADLKFYHNFLFLETRNKDQMLWSRIVDCSREIVFRMDWDEFPARRKKLVAIRRSNISAPAGGVAYLPTGTQMLFASTLQEDITCFDFTLSVLQSRQALSTSGRDSSMEVMLEMDSLNEHECMAPLCGLVQHMVELKISPPPDDNPSALPCWMDAIRKSLDDEENPRNARLFILKLILNCESVFRPYAKFWFMPVMKALLSRCAGSSINYMLTDLMTMLLEWHDVAIPNSSDVEKHLASQVLYFFMANVESSRRDVFKHNIEVVKTIVELWKPCLNMPYQLLVDRINIQGNADATNTEVGLQLVAVVLANGIEPWNAAGKKLVLELLVSNLESHKPEVYLPCAEVAGMVLKVLGADEDSELSGDAGDFLQQTEQKLTKMKTPTSNLSKFVLCLHGMAKHCSYIVKQFSTFLCFQVHKLSGTLQAKCLEMIGMWPEAISELVSTGVGELLGSHNVDVQEAALTAVNLIVHQLDTSQLLNLVPYIVRFVSHPSVLCRHKMFKILIWMYDKYSENSSSQEQLLFEESRTALIRGLVDADATVQEVINSFWDSSARFPAVTSQRLLVLMKNLYSPTTEDLMTICLAHLLLQASMNAPDDNAKIFDHPLGACQFEEYRMLVSWRAQHTTTAPLFADTLASQLRSQDPQSFNMMVRATQESLAFKPTVDTSDEDNALETSMNTLSSSSTSTLFTLGSGYHTTTELNSARSQLQSGFARPETTKSFLRRRFLKNRNAIREIYAKREVSRNLRREEMQRERVKRREATVSMYRTYRIGDLPDIEIPHSAIIKPLQALAKQDASVACQVVVALFLGISGNMQDKAMFLQESGTVMKHMLKSTVQCCPSVIEMILKMAFPNTDHIQLFPEDLCTASRASGLFSLGALVLEKMLLSASEDAQIPAKRARTLVSQEDGLWLQLAELYSGLDEWDVVRGVFSDKLNCTEAMKDALVAESGRDWHTAHLNYMDAIKQEDCNYQDYCRQAYYKCLSHLSKWEELKTHVYEDAEEDLDNLWKDPWYQEKVLPWFLSSELQLNLNILGHSGESPCHRQVLQKVQEWMQDSEKAHHLKCNYSEVLAVMWLLKGDYSMARHHALHDINMFLVSWAHVNPLARKSRAGMVLALCRAVEMHTYLELATVSDKEIYQQCVGNLLDKWSSTVPSENDSLVIWDQRIAYRLGFAKQIEERLNLASMANAHLLQKLASSKLEMELKFVDVALNQRNFHLAREYLQRTKAMVNNTEAEERIACWSLYYSRLLYLRADQEEELPRKFHRLLDAWKELDSMMKMGTSSHGPLLAKAYQHQSMLSQEMMCLISRDASLVQSSNEDKVAALLNHLSIARNSGTDAILRKLKYFGLSCLENAIKSMTESAQGKEMADAYFNIAQYCRSDAVKSELDSSSSELDHHVVQSILRAMKFGSRAARQLFPCVLQLPGLSSVHRHTFLTESGDVPEWMFLSWVSQILANLDTINGLLLERIILRLAQSYPQAVVFPFNISCTKYAFLDTEEGRQGQALVLRLKKILQGNRLLETFVEAFTYLAPQRLILQYHLKALQICLQNVPFDSIRFREMLQLTLKESYPSENEQPRLHGKLFIMEVLRDKLVGITGHDGSKVNTRNIRNVANCLNKLESKLAANKWKSSSKISDYCPWLDEFQATRFTDEIEIPGQYTGDKRPLPHLHAKIVSFAKSVLVMKSKCCPVRITIHGSDAKEHKFLVKFGEDLRQDQRIQQLFQLMNEILNRDAACSHRRLHLMTYNVVPLNSRVGIIQWVDNTESLETLFKMTMTSEEVKACEQITALYVKWIHASSRTSCEKESLYYLSACDRYTREETVAKFREFVDRLPLDILRRSLELLSISLEAFFTLRHNFSSSYATMCVCHWLLGVGDRHLQNCLVSVEDACCVGIDFGCSFGLATQFLPVPELLPFRFTPHIVSLMKPFELSGIFQETMVCVLRALRSNHDMLLATMEVFVQEPSLDWLELARRQGDDISGPKQQRDGRLCNEMWYPRQKVLLARRKFQGANPAAITIEELRSGVNKSRKFEDVARGDPAYNVRARMASDKLSPEDQVACLLDQATDYNILGKTWCGWQPWM